MTRDEKVDVLVRAAEAGAFAECFQDGGWGTVTFSENANARALDVVERLFGERPPGTLLTAFGIRSNEIWEAAHRAASRRS